MEKQMTKYLEKHILNAERKLEIMKTKQEMFKIDEQLKALELFKRWYPPHSPEEHTDPDCAVHIAPLSS